MPMTAAALALMLLSASATPSAALPATEPSQPGIEVRLDGVGFGEGVSEPLFRDPPVVVPGDVVSAMLWVRNGSDQDAVVRFSGTGAWSSSAAFAEQLMVSAGPEGRDDSVRVPLGESAGCALLYSGPVLPPGGVLALEVSLAFAADTTGRDAHSAQAGIDFVATLRDPAEPVSAAADCAGAVIPGLPTDPEGNAGPSNGSPGSIASTGFAALLLGGACLAALLVGVPMLAVTTYRRRRVR
jgi:hypothetical protein